MFIQKCTRYEHITIHSDITLLNKSIFGEKIRIVNWMNLAIVAVCCWIQFQKMFSRFAVKYYSCHCDTSFIQKKLHVSDWFETNHELLQRKSSTNILLFVR